MRDKYMSRYKKAEVIISLPVLQDIHNPKELCASLSAADRYKVVEYKSYVLMQNIKKNEKYLK